MTKQIQAIDVNALLKSLKDYSKSFKDDKEIKPVLRSINRIVRKESKLHTVEIDNEDFGAMVISAVRYAFGRRTYITSWTVEYFTPLLPYLTSHTLWVLNEDFEKPLCGWGDECDEAVWRQFWQSIKDEIINRMAQGDEYFRFWRR